MSHSSSKRSLDDIEDKGNIPFDEPQDVIQKSIVNGTNSNSQNNSSFAKRLVERIPTFVFVSYWVCASGAMIFSNSTMLTSNNFRFPIFLTCWHMLFATCATQLMGRFTTMLDSRHQINMNPRLYIRAIAPIGLCFAISLVLSNQAYLYLSVAFTQMLKASAPVDVLLITYLFRLEKVNYSVLSNIIIIAFGTAIASYGELAFNLIGFLSQTLAIFAESIRLVLMGQLLSGRRKMDPLVTLYYFAPICTIILSFAFLVLEYPRISMDAINATGKLYLLGNACTAFSLNIASVLLMAKTSSLVMTLCGIVKDILMVCLSSIFLHNGISHTQLLGYSIAVMGLMYYKLGSILFKK